MKRDKDIPDFCKIKFIDFNDHLIFSLVQTPDQIQHLFCVYNIAGYIIRHKMCPNGFWI